MQVNTDTHTNTKWGGRGLANTAHGIQEQLIQLQIQIQRHTDEIQLQETAVKYTNTKE